MSGYELNPDAMLEVVPPMVHVRHGIPMPPTDRERVERFRARWQKCFDDCRMEHDAMIAGGVAWLDDYRKRIICPPDHNRATGRPTESATPSQ